MSGPIRSTAVVAGPLPRTVADEAKSPPADEAPGPRQVTDGFDRQPLNLSLPNLGPEPSSSKTTDAASGAMRAAVDRYTARLESVVVPSAMSMARGAPALTSGALSAAQEVEFRHATNDFLNELPLGALSPTLADRIQEALKGEGLTVPDLQITPVGRLPQVARNLVRDAARDYVDALRHEAPAAYYSLAAAGAAAIGYVAWEHGTSKGLKPELAHAFFNSRLEVKVGAEWAAHFKDFQLTTTVTGHADLGDAGHLAATVTANSRTGVDRGRLDYAFGRPELSGAAYLTVNQRGVETIGASVTRMPNSHLVLTARVEHNRADGRTSATAEAALRVSENVDVAASATTDTNHQTHVGVGVKVRF